jgi:hypothetical protein
MNTDSEETVEETEEHIADNKQMLVALDTAIDKIDAALPTVRDLEASDAEMDDLADLAKNTFTDLIDLAMNVEARFSGPILQSASTLLGHAVTAKMAKMDKKLKMVDLQLKKAKLDQAAANQSPADKAVDGKGVVLDRNALLQSILEASKHK